MTSTIVPGLIDTEIMVACVNGHPPAIRFFLAINRRYAPQFSRLTAIELLAGSLSDAERGLVVQYLVTAKVMDLTDLIACRAVDILSKVTLPTTLTADDVIVAATAIEHSLPLYTLDPARFATVPQLITIQPF